ncbi:hypothetical protein HYC85_008939 [Camellia sinensis]|uniref:peroxidase n=1 Tax=Camellia sinensis TaxID=4442 RepID=A0A7J7HTB3_CAMSI|nr:hypothetical protein HYC85_008939 [Camellia sinensis]
MHHIVVIVAHTTGFAQCFTFKRRLFNFKGSDKPDPTLDSSLLSSLRSTCPNVDSSNSQLAPPDSATSSMFDNAYYKNLVSNSGLLKSDQALMGDSKTSSMINSYSMYPFLFSKDFGESMVKPGYGVNGVREVSQNKEIRKKCGSIN